MAYQKTSYDPHIVELQNFPRDVHEPATNWNNFAGSRVALLNDVEEKKEDKKVRGLKLSLRLFLAVAFVVLGVNLGWLVWAKTRYTVVDPVLGPGYATIFRGDCREAGNINLYLHLLINVLSTLLLLGSGSFLQAFSSPTRAELDRAHQRKRWLHIGTLSFRNLSSISKRKALVCIVLALTSIPFHLLYNSLIFNTATANGYYWAVVTESFLHGAPFNISLVLQYSTIPYTHASDAFHTMQSNHTALKHLAPFECIKAYSNSFSSARRNLLLISATRNDTNSILDWGSVGSNRAYEDGDETTDKSSDDSGYNQWNSWLCPSKPSYMAVCQPFSFFPNGDGFQINGNDISYCLSEETEEICAVRFSWDIMWVVLSFNLAKLLAMVYVLFRFDAEHLLSSVGDVMSSILLRTDPACGGMCLTEKRSVRNGWPQAIAYPYDPRPGRLARASSKKRWVFFSLLMGGSIFVVVVFLYWGVTFLRSESVDPWSLGFGTSSLNPSALAFANNVGSMVGMAVLANVPQLILSIIYLVYQGIMVSMFLARDWNAFAFMPEARVSSSRNKYRWIPFSSKRKQHNYQHATHEPDLKNQTLMVSTPTGDQRGTWLLGLPLIPGILSIAFQILLHWTVSQSLFAVSIDLISPNSNYLSVEGYPNLTNCGYSPIAACAAIAAGMVLFLSTLVVGSRPLKQGGPPIVGTCSAAIAASCVLPRGLEVEDMVRGGLRWGQVGGITGGYGHCSMAPTAAWDAGFAGPAVPGVVYL